MRNNMDKVPFAEQRTAFIILITITILCHLAYQFLVKRCVWWECPPNRDFSVFDLNLPDEFFPPGADIHPLQPDRVEDAIEEAVTTNYWEDGLAIYSVLRFPTRQKASEWHHFELKIYKFDRQLENPQLYSTILNYQSDVADEYIAKCGYVISKDLRCVFWARYQEYHIFFSGSMEDGEIVGMTQENYLDLMEYIDNRMDVLLNSE